MNKKLFSMNELPAGWPQWVVQPTHPVERELLSWLLDNDKYLKEVYFIIQTLHINYMVYRKNYDELIMLMDKFNDPMIFRSLAMGSNDGLIIASETILEFTRLLHNFLASVKMLIETTRRWVNEQFEGTEFLSAYQKQIDDRFLKNMQAKFLEDLRNFTLHRALPIAYPQIRFQEVNEHELKSSLGIVLIKQHLLEGDKWSELGRLQLQMELGNEVDIRPIIESYNSNVTEFTRWLSWQVRYQFSQEVDEINSIYKQTRKTEDS